MLHSETHYYCVIQCHLHAQLLDLNAIVTSRFSVIDRVRYRSRRVGQIVKYREINDAMGDAMGDAMQISEKYHLFIANLLSHDAYP
jgi:hypothetical protein